MSGPALLSGPMAASSVRYSNRQWAAALDNPYRNPDEPGFNPAYRGTPPWDISHPQAEFVRLEESGEIRGAVLDVGCGTGEHVLYLARRGHEAWGIDSAPLAIEKAREKSAQRGIPQRSSSPMPSSCAVCSERSTQSSTRGCSTCSRQSSARASSPAWARSFRPVAGISCLDTAIRIREWPAGLRSRRYLPRVRRRLADQLRARSPLRDPRGPWTQDSGMAHVDRPPLIVSVGASPTCWRRF